jgi:hypothetical protein
MRTCALLVIVALLIAAGCAWAQPDDATMFRLASALTKLARVVDDYVASTTTVPSSSTALIEAATADDPGLREPFKEYWLSVSVAGRNSAVLVCSLDRQRALLEDAGCTARLERHAWRETPPPPCASTLNPSAICKRP